MSEPDPSGDDRPGEDQPVKDQPREFNDQPGEFNDQPGEFNDQPGEFNDQPGEFSDHLPREFNDQPGEFSDHLEDWLSSEGTKTLGGLGEVFGEKSFAVTILVLMFLPALPIPTAGISDLFTCIAIVVAAQMVLGRTTLWLPERWSRRELGRATIDRALPFIARRIRWFERFSRPRGIAAFQRRTPLRVVGLAVIALAVATIVAPPFSGLDTLPAMGAVVLALSIVLEDIVVLGIGAALGAVGIVLELALGAAAVELVQRVV